MCVLCPEDSKRAWEIFRSYVIAAALAAVVVPFIVMNGKTLSRLEPRWMKNSRRMATDLGTIKIFVTTYQLISSMAWTLEVRFPSPFNEFLDVLKM